MLRKKEGMSLWPTLRGHSWNGRVGKNALALEKKISESEQEKKNA